MKVEDIKKIANEAAKANAERWYKKVEKKLFNELEKVAKDGYDHLPITIMDKWAEGLLTDKTLQDKLKKELETKGFKIDYNSYKDGSLAIIKWK